VHDGKIIEDDFMFGMITNSRSVAGFVDLIGKDVVFDDGEFEVTLIKAPKNAMELNEIVASLLMRQIDSHYMYSFRTGEIHLESKEEIPWTLDGEFGGEHDEVVIRNIKQGLQIMVSERTSERSGGMLSEEE
jgi:diacylglycerol kinase family enzyme